MCIVQDVHLDLGPSLSLHGNGLGGGLGGLADDGGDLYHEQYDEHGVKIEKPLTDAELMSRYLGSCSRNILK